ncbi:PAS domain-containing protein [Azospirillum thermophilum]|uniref:Chemotaxis protein n=1 Tax=Azospirillum thermophilum TaxID=2202148 RepID=A0A2S2CQX9_9PROT|nr:PAS domain-containing protein [Azospirillum thermophilum]AWK86770.1 chemotaxis protein [Azospirillum thermophilum]
MARRDVSLTGVERFFDPGEVIVSKTDLKGRITYANRVFQRVAGYSEAELLGAPHSIVRHPDMPRCVFKLLWATLEAKQEIFAYVVNRARSGDHYWVFAHVTPSFDAQGRVIGYHSSRRVPERSAIDKVVPLYRQLLDIENSHADRKQGMEAAFATVVALLTEKGIGYDEFVFSL